MRVKMGWLALAGLLVTAGSALVVAATPPDPAFMYRGHLELNGVPQNTPHDLVVKLYSVPTAGSAVGTAFTFSQVQMVAGDFTVAVGPLTDTQLATDPLYIEISVDGTTLQGRQRIHAVPFAMRGRATGNYFVDGKLNVTTGGAVTGTLNADLVVGGGKVKVGDLGGWNNSNSIAFTQTAGDDTYAGRIAYRVDGDNALTLVGAGATGSRFIKLWDNVTIQKQLTAPNTQATAWCDCELNATVEGGADVPYNFLFAITGNNVCRAGRFLVGFAVNGSNGGCDAMHCMEQMKCCRPCNLVGN